MKTSKEYFERFKKEFLYWQTELGLMQYRIVFFHIPLKENYAEIIVEEIDKIAKVSLSTDLDKIDLQNDPGPEAHGKHEAIHLLTNRLFWLGDCRYIATTDLNEEWEAIVRRLEKVLNKEKT